MHTMKHTRERKGLMVMKIDLEKAYDRIRWEFVKQVLEETSMDTLFVNLIMECISSISYNILWNGSQTNFFPAKRGLRQGDSISLLLFVLYMDKLSSIITNEINLDHWKLIMITKEGPSISHLMFADDILLFGEATKNQANCMMKCLRMFCHASGGKVSKPKLSIFFSSRVPINVKQSIALIFGFHISSE